MYANVFVHTQVTRLWYRLGVLFGCLRTSGLGWTCLRYFKASGQRVNNRTCGRVHFAYCRFRPGLFPAVWGGVGWGGLLTFMFTRSRGGCCVADMFSWGVWGGLITFMCTSTHTSCYATVHSHSYAPVRSLALPHTRHATLLCILTATPLYILLHFHTHVMLRYCTFFILHCHRHMSCYATLLYVLLQSPTHTRHQISSTYTLSDLLLHWKTSSNCKPLCGSF